MGNCNFDVYTVEYKESEGKWVTKIIPVSELTPLDFAHEKVMCDPYHTDNICHHLNSPNSRERTFKCSICGKWIHDTMNVQSKEWDLIDQDNEHDADPARNICRYHTYPDLHKNEDDFSSLGITWLYSRDMTRYTYLIRRLQEFGGVSKSFCMPEKHVSLMTIEELRAYATVFDGCITYSSEFNNGNHLRFSNLNLNSFLTYEEYREIRDLLNSELRRRVGEDVFNIYAWMKKEHKIEEHTGNMDYQLLVYSSCEYTNVGFDYIINAGLMNKALKTCPIDNFTTFISLMDDIRYSHSAFYSYSNKKSVKEIEFKWADKYFEELLSFIK